MDAIVYLMFAAVISMTTALTFMEVRRIRKRLDGQQQSNAAPVEAKTRVAV